MPWKIFANERDYLSRQTRAKASCRPTCRSESYAHPHLRTQHATTNDRLSPNIVAAWIEVEHRALVRGARAVGLRLTAIRTACVRQGKHHRRPPLPEMCARRQGRKVFRLLQHRVSKLTISTTSVGRTISTGSNAFGTYTQCQCTDRLPASR
jgi:hypothetical protein